MSGNSGDSFSDDSDGEGAEKEEVKVEVAVAKKKGPGRPPRKKRGPIATPVNTMLPVAHKRRCIQPKSGKWRSPQRLIIIINYVDTEGTLLGSVAKMKLKYIG